jgi:catechol 2,3-dioxygenase-like lactoylglutathione lyase family enzyme
VSDGVAFNHVGQCVTDLARARRFYVELLGFSVQRELHPPDEPSSRLLRLDPPLGMTALYLVRDGFVLELLHFDRAGNPPGRPRVVNEPGLTHVSLSVDDLDGVLARVPEYGGEVLDDTNIGLGVFVRDPEGQLVELLPMSYRERLDAPGT